MAPTPQGRIASHYYLSCDSMKTIGSALRPTLSDIDLLKIFSSSHEFINVRTRASEKLELRNLIGRVRLENLEC
jgi:pre-mRNA-splicing helicase BRR2